MQRQRVTDIEHHHKADDFRAGFEVAKWARLGHSRRLSSQIASVKSSPLTAPGHASGVRPADMQGCGMRCDCGRLIQRRALDKCGTQRADKGVSGAVAG